MNTFDLLVKGWIGIALILVPMQLYVTAPYGRHMRKGWGKTIPYRWGWILMELVSPLVFGWFFIIGDNEKSAVMWVMFALWMAHYFNRSIIYPSRAKMKKEAVPLFIVVSAGFFNLVNGFLNGYWLGSLALPYPEDWFSSPYFLIGSLFFVIGAAINIYSDHQLVSLRKPGERVYKIPYGGLFRWISCPNHFGEILEWTGFAILCWNLPALSFAIWSAANLIPRAISHHKWYRSKFGPYPAERKAVIPFVL